MTQSSQIKQTPRRGGNQYTEESARATQKATTARLQSEVKADPVVIPVVRSSDEVRRMLNERLYVSQNRHKMLEGQIMALRGELEDEAKVIDSITAALNILDDKNRPKLVEKAS